MDMSDIKYLLNQVLETWKLPQGEFDLEEYVKYYRSFSATKEFKQINNNLIDQLRNTPGLDIVDNKFRLFGRSWGNISYSSVAYSLLMHSVRVGVDKALDDLALFIKKETFTCHQILLIGGIKIKDDIELHDGITIKPFDNNNKSHLDLLPDDDFPIDARAYKQISAMIEKKFEHVKEFVDASVFESNQSVYQQKGFDIFKLDKLEDISLCLTLLGPSCTETLSSSIGTVDWVPGLEGKLGMIPMSLSMLYYDPLVRFDVEKFKEIYKKFKALRTKSKDRLRLALGRLNMSLKRRNEVDTIIDITIALEILFSENKEVDSSIRFALRLNAARYLRNDREKREKLAKFINQLYDLRSAGVHKGKLSIKTIEIDPKAIIKQAQNLVVEAIEKIILEGWPDWKEIQYS